MVFFFSKRQSGDKGHNTANSGNSARTRYRQIKSVICFGHMLLMEKGAPPICTWAMREGPSFHMFAQAKHSPALLQIEMSGLSIISISSMASAIVQRLGRSNKSAWDTLSRSSRGSRCQLQNPGLILSLKAKDPKLQIGRVIPLCLTPPGVPIRLPQTLLLGAFGVAQLRQRLLGLPGLNIRHQGPWR